MSQFLRPNGDVGQSGSWVPEPSDTTLWNVIDETSANDSDYVWHNAVGGGEWFEVSLNNPGAIPGSGDHIFRIRVGRIDGTKEILVRMSLYQGETEICFKATNFPFGDEFTTLFHTLTEEQKANITDYNSLTIKVTVTSTSGGGKSSDPAISWAEFEVPDGGGVTPGWNKILYASEPPTPNAWNQVKRESGTGWKKLLYT